MNSPRVAGTRGWGGVPKLGLNQLAIWRVEAAEILHDCRIVARQLGVRARSRIRSGPAGISKDDLRRAGGPLRHRSQRGNRYGHGTKKSEVRSLSTNGRGGSVMYCTAPQRQPGHDGGPPSGRSGDKAGLQAARPVLSGPNGSLVRTRPWGREGGGVGTGGSKQAHGRTQGALARKDWGAYGWQ